MYRIWQTYHYKILINKSTDFLNYIHMPTLLTYLTLGSLHPSCRVHTG